MVELTLIFLRLGWRIPSFLPHPATHISMDIHDICKVNNIVHYTFPANASHIVLLLDFIFYKSLKEEWMNMKALSAYRVIHVDNVKKDNFALVFKQAWKKAYSPSKLINVFEAADSVPGIWTKLTIKSALPVKFSLPLSMLRQDILLL